MPDHPCGLRLEDLAAHLHRTRQKQALVVDLTHRRVALQSGNVCGSIENKRIVAARPMDAQGEITLAERL